MTDSLGITILGLSITSSWGNGHATTFRGLVRGLSERGHRVLFLERDVPWYANNRDLPRPPFGQTALYGSLEQLRDEHEDAVRSSDLVIVGSYVPEGIAIGEWVNTIAAGATAFYDIDTPVTLAKLARGDCEYLNPELVARYGLYLSFTGGPTLDYLHRHYGSPMARPLYCSVDPDIYYPEATDVEYDLTYMGTYSDDRQPPLDRLLLESARRWSRGRFAVAGPQYPDSIDWPPNVRRITHLAPARHRRFYNSGRYTLNITRADMIRCGHSPSVRLFEAAACGTPIISDWWEGIEELFAPGEEILIAERTEDVLEILKDRAEGIRSRMGERARAKVLERHTHSHRAMELERFVAELYAHKASQLHRRATVDGRSVTRFGRLSHRST